MSDSRDDFIIAIRSALLQKGAKQKFSIFFLISLSLAIITLDIISFPATIFVRSLINDAIYRTSAYASTPIKMYSYSHEKIRNHLSVYSDNEKLLKELDTYKSKKFNIEYLETENKFLKQRIDIYNSNIEETSVLAKVILDKESPFLKSFIVNKGSKDNIRKGMPVLNDFYLVGKVIEVNYFSSRVLLLNDLNSKIPITLQNDNVQAILSGTGSKNPSLDYLPENYESDVGTTIFTSGKDGLFKAGIPIGKISLDKNNKKSVSLFVDSDQLLIVNIIGNVGENID